MMTYTDRSGINGYIEAAAFCQSKNESRWCYLRKDSESNVYTNELKAIHMTTTMIQGNIHCYTKCIIFTDSQAVIKTFAKSKYQSEQAIIKKILWVDLQSTP